MSLLTAISLHAGKKKEVLLKFNKQESLLRIVFEADETFVNRIKVSTSSSQIKLDFPEPFDLTSQKDLPFQIVPSEKSVVITLKEKGEIKFFRLTAPARLVIDIQKMNMQTEKPPATVVSRGIVIDAGHGGYDFGITYGGVSEKDFTLSLAKDLGSAFSKKGKKVFLIRRADQYIPIAERINFVNQKSPEVFISFHSSSSKNFVLYSPKFEEQASNEVTDFYSLSSKQKKYIAKSKSLSNTIEKAIKDEFKAEVIRREMPLPLLNSVGAAAVLIELPSPVSAVYDQQMKTGIINSILNGIAAYGQ